MLSSISNEAEDYLFDEQREKKSAIPEKGFLYLFMKLIFFGTSDFSKPIFEALKKEDYSPILWSLDNSFDDFKKMQPDICIVAAYGKIIPKEYLEIPKYGFLNIHPSLLPKYRGPSPIQAAILNGDKETGVTIILMDEKIDHGQIIAYEKLKIKNEKYKDLENRLTKLGGKLLIEILPEWTIGKIKAKEQNHNEATFTKKFSWENGKIDWSKSAEEIDRQIHALNPEPGTWTKWQGKILKILETKPLESKIVDETGKIIFIEDQIIVKCGQNALFLKKVQLEGRKPTQIQDFIRGHQNFINSVLT